MLSARGRYSKYLRPISISIDLLVITLLPFFLFKEQGVNYLHFCVYQIVSWSFIAYFSGFYDVYRYTSILKIFSKLITQCVIFLLTVIAFFPFAKETVFNSEAILLYSIVVLCTVTLFKLLLFFYLKKYRIAGSNTRNAIIIGHTQQTVNLKNLFETKAEYGYRFKGFFSDKKQGDLITGRVADIESFALENKIDDIYCSLNEISNLRLRELVAFCDANNKVIKFIPDTKEIFSRNLTVDYYEFFPVLSLRKTPLHEPIATIAKRVFDIVFAFLVILLVLSWLTPIMALLIKLESKGPVFYRQIRAGMNEEQFFCFKFRSMQINNQMDQLAVKNDPRVTKVGKFIRKTSIDELPQFLNVLLGDMSVVGPRPHIYSINHRYSVKIKKYGARHTVKPGITGLAQVRGFRGEITSDEDMINRIKYDVFYIENWSILLDIKIILQTIVGMFGDEKAY
ncbi:sugar transferase [Flavobacterium psychrophilum]|nr:sugar transferase [Flavobacterium psychrophilum]AOE54376.1 sugar transferase [Flavobacterium psychrophilum]